MRSRVSVELPGGRNSFSPWLFPPAFGGRCRARGFRRLERHQWKPGSLRHSHPGRRRWSALSHHAAGVDATKGSSQVDRRTQSANLESGKAALENAASRRAGTRFGQLSLRWQCGDRAGGKFQLLSASTGPGAALRAAECRCGVPHRPSAAPCTTGAAGTYRIPPKTNTWPSPKDRRSPCPLP